MLDNRAMMRDVLGVQAVKLRLINRAPKARRRHLLYEFRRQEFERYLSRMLGPAFHPVDPGPVAPAELIAQTSVLSEAELRSKSQPTEYFGGAYQGMLYFLRVLERCSFNLRTAGAMLDFGCGTGKNIRLFRGIEGLRLVGTDVNPAVIEWARANVTGVEFQQNAVEPPLEFAESSSFDLVTAGSVFTHIPLDLQLPWLEELSRVMRPGGYFICTVAGGYHMRLQLSPEQRERLQKEGHFTLAAGEPGVSLATTNAGSWDVFQTRAEVLRAFRQVFDVVDYLTPRHGQDVLVLRRPPVRALTTNVRADVDDRAHELAKAF